MPQVDANGPPALVVEGLRVEYGSRDSAAVDEVSFELRAGGSLAIIGESGSGKSSVGLALMGLLRPPSAAVSGQVLLQGTDLIAANEHDMADMRGRRIAMVFQDPLSSLNPVKRVGDQIAEMFVRHHRRSRSDSLEAAVETMRRVHIPDAGTRARDYPHQFSGGMRQRVMIAMAIALGPSVLIADEPTTALDVTVQAQVVDLLREIRAEEGMALLLISHDLGLAAALSEELMVLYGGRVAERGPLRRVIRRPAHPYTEGLIRSAPGITAASGRLAAIPGSPPSLDRMPAGCSFHPRCPLADDRCRRDRPDVVNVEPGRLAACHHSERVLDGTAP